MSKKREREINLNNENNNNTTTITNNKKYKKKKQIHSSSHFNSNSNSSSNSNLSSSSTSSSNSHPNPKTSPRSHSNSHPNSNSHSNSNSNSIISSDATLQWVFEVDYNDHFETPQQSYIDIINILNLVSKECSKKYSDLIIYDPYYCNGRVINLLNNIGINNVINRNRDFYEDIKNNDIPGKIFHFLIFIFNLFKLFFF